MVFLWIPRGPAVFFEIAFFLGVKRDAFGFEHDLLNQRPVDVRTRADAALAVDDALPGDVGVASAGAHGVPHGPGGAGGAENSGDLAVGHDASFGDLADEFVDGFVEVRFVPFSSFVHRECLWDFRRFKPLR